MISLDTNVVLSALAPFEVQHQKAIKMLQMYQNHGFTLSPFVYAELRASVAWRAIAVFLQEAHISVLWPLNETTFELAGSAFGLYAELRKKGKLPRRILADFLIAAHAQEHGLSIMTFDDIVYQTVFKNVKVIDS